MKKYSLVLLTLSVICLIISGCSFSHSSKSISKSIKSSSKSISSPSRWSSGNKNSAVKTANSYQNETAVLTSLYAKSDGTSQDFQRELSTISRRHGIVDWENNTQTFTAIGVGLKRSGVSKESIKTLSFLQGDNIFDHYSDILSGYSLPKNVS